MLRDRGGWACPAHDSSRPAWLSAGRPRTGEVWLSWLSVRASFPPTPGCNAGCSVPSTRHQEVRRAHPGRPAPGEADRGTRDPNIRTIRIDRVLPRRGARPRPGEVRAAQRPAARRRHRLRGQPPVHRQPGARRAGDPRRGGPRRVRRARAAPQAARGGLFDHVATADLVRLGVEEDLLPLLRVIATDEQLESLGRPPARGTSSTCCAGLASGLSVEEVWAELADRIVSGKVDTDDLLTAARRTPERITFVSGPIELAEILRAPVRRVAHVPAPDAARHRLPRHLQRARAGDRQRRHRQDGDRPAPGGLPRPAAGGRGEGAADHLHPRARRRADQPAVPAGRPTRRCGPGST